MVISGMYPPLGTLSFISASDISQEEKSESVGDDMVVERKFNDKVLDNEPDLSNGWMYIRFADAGRFNELPDAGK